MKRLQQFIIAVSILGAVLGSPYDDGKYKPMKYDEYDDGKYYRPRHEGKYVRGDEGRYTYIYQQGIWPYDGTYKYLNEKDDPYQGYRVYAERYPYINGVIKGLVSKYVSSDKLNFGEATEGSTNHYSKVYADKEVAVKCQYVMPDSNKQEFTSQYPPQMKVKDGEKPGQFYSFKGSKVLSTVKNALTSKMKLQYEVFVKVVEDVSSSDEEEVTTKTNKISSPLVILRPPSTDKVTTVVTKSAPKDIPSPLVILRPPSTDKITTTVAEAVTQDEVKSTITEIVKSLIVDDVLPTVGGAGTPKDLKLTIDDVQLLPNDDSTPTISYSQTFADDFKPTTDSAEVQDEDLKSTLSNVPSLIDDGDNILIIDLQSSTEAGER